MKVYGKTDVGMVRTNNQDSYSAAVLADGAAYGIVCDGMGGVNGGQIASSTVVRHFEEKIKGDFAPGLSDDDCEKLLLSALKESNSSIMNTASNDNTLSGMGTTCVAAILSNGMLKLINVGDSRAYLIQKGHITKLTKDHSMVQHLVDIGQISEEEAKNHPQKNIITRAVGTDNSIEADSYIKPFGKGDILVICTDGLSNTVDMEEILSEIRKGTDSACENLIALANKRGGSDNITVLIIADEQ